MRRPAAALAALVLTAGVNLSVATPASAAAASPLGAASSTMPGYDCDGPAGVGQRLPVVLVHGFTSSAQTWSPPTRELLAKNLAVCTTALDYSSRATNWVDDPLIGPALAKRIKVLGSASKKAGGPGQVVVVAHSMGGLALRCAAAAGCSGVAGVTSMVAGAVTLGTPNLGTFAKDDGRSHVPNLAATTFGSVCAAGQGLTSTAGGLCGKVRAFLTSDAARAFTPGSAQLKALAPMPDGVPVYALAGQIEVRTSMYGRLPVTIGRVGDVIVAPASAHAQATSGDGLGGKATVDCGYVDVTFTSPPSVKCSHVTMTNNSKFLDPAVTMIAEILRKQERSLPRPGGKVTGRIGFKHPSWGLSTLVTTQLADKAGGWLYAVDGFQNVRWARQTGGGSEELAPHTPSVDKLGHLFVNYNPGRYNGVIVLKPTATGFDDFESMPPVDDYDGRFYSAEAVDVDDDGQLEIVVESNDCNPSCAGGTVTAQTFGWDGNDYAAAPAPARDAACDGGAEAAVCRFVTAVQSGDLSTLTEAERDVAAGIDDLPDDPWVLDRCELIGDVTVHCQVEFQTQEQNSEPAAAGFSVGPSNGTYDDGQITTPQGEDLRYEVDEYLGLDSGCGAVSDGTQSYAVGAPSRFDCDDATSLLNSYFAAPASAKEGSGAYWYSSETEDLYCYAVKSNPDVAYRCDLADDGAVAEARRR